MTVQPESDSAVTRDSSSNYVRLHITPFNPNLLTTIIPASTLPSARNISYHSLQTFPEKAYGYIELPAMEADKLKKKLNGSILKGTKIRIEKARPRKEITPTEVEEPAMEKKSSSRKRKRDPGAIQGAEIGDRHVKRGWTTPAAALRSEKRSKSKEKEKEKRTIVKSKYTTNPECLFKTVVPPNVAANVVDPALTKAKADKKKCSKKGKEVVVHEFAKTTKHATFLKSSTAAPGNSKTAVEFVDGRGWVDEDGNVVEEVIKKERKSTKVDKHELQTKVANEGSSVSETSFSEGSSSDDELHSDKEDTSLEQAEGDSLTSGSGTSSDEEESDGTEQKEVIEANEDSSKESSAKTSSDEESTSEDSSSEDESPAVETEMPKQPRPRSLSGTAPNLSIKIPPPIPSTPIASHARSDANEVHPLEALFKKPHPNSNQPAPEQSSFSFFGGDEKDINDDNDNQLNAVSQYQVPLTPFTQRDFEYRGLRSAAPTPDTAFPNKRFVWPSENGDEVDEEEDYKGSPSRGVKGHKVAGEKAETESDFQKWFYEHRGDTNRAWKKRRKMAAKEKRQRENRKRTDKAA